MTRKRLTNFIFALAFLLPQSLSADWRQFRGPNGSGISSGATAPIRFGPGQNELWSVPVPQGHSSPCVSGPFLFLNAFDSDEKQLKLICIERQTGKSRWSFPIAAKEIESGHPSFSPASSTPASDGEVVVSYFGSFGLVCCDISGNELWHVEMPLAKSYCGNATSPIIAGDNVILYRGNYVDHFVISLDKRTGKQHWKTELSEEFTSDMACSATPVVAGDKLITHGARAVQAIDIRSGNIVWEAKCQTTGTSTPILVGDEVVVGTWNQTGESSLTPEEPTFGELLKENDQDNDRRIGRNEFPRLMIFHRSEGTEAPENGAPVRFDHVDANKDGQIVDSEWEAWCEKGKRRRARYVPHGLLAIKLDSKGVVDPDQIRYLARSGVPEVPSPIHHDSRVYMIKNGGILTCIDIESTEQLYRMRTKGRGTHYASPVISGNYLYSTAGDGRISVLSLESKAKVVAINQMQEKVFATPAIVDGTIYVRTHQKMFAFKNVR